MGSQEKPAAAKIEDEKLEHAKQRSNIFKTINQKKDKRSKQKSENEKQEWENCNSEERRNNKKQKSRKKEK